MSTFRKHFTVIAIAMLALLFASVREVRAGAMETPKLANCRNLPVIKNLTGLKAQHDCDRMAAPQTLTKADVKKLAATAKSPEDHLTIARFYKAEANGLEAQAAGYKQAAANLRNGPVVKNLMSPATPANFDFAAKEFRDEAKADRALAASHEEMAKTTVALRN